ncbi:cobyrinate a,c-diamide synthase [Conexibacter sp. JD483]|uniref:cobyrinate a,c-diamide synthase n=1 Tax=unclassified Conexibacter TaxID=2627773 RepID=UPI0027173F8B|nr:MULTISPECIES: cobyrinate a,c-diamide synthase [unclassified Conexibacter]MDO8189334.1 cobyrinate a,c-diamide synthase [Conexibacter sp. CPCC 205706]MDO8201393.1 cobyrinate a,c-diamide synthase [Conexibacter sp. CPCC 205762]MDR9372401.1 cobyrinate a,c-diamide synthase [Conexibacter sp. JD483]
MIPRLVVAGTSSGAGKTTIASGLIGALRARGLRVQGFKVGPDYIDPSYHALASGRPGRNLDAYLAGTELIAPLFRHGSGDADIAVIEGVMGLFDGASGRGELASTAQVSKLLHAPVVLVVDGSAMARSAAAIVHGFATFDPQVDVAGVIFNRVGSDVHEQLLREAVEPLGLPVLGALRRDERISAPERHLGLVPVAEREPRTRAALALLAATLADRLDLDALLALARTAPSIDGAAWSPHVGAAAASQTPAVEARDGGADVRDRGADVRDGGAPARIAIARGPAFSFHYQENLELLEAAGAELLPFDPLRDETLPEGTEALVLAGGFPEVFGAELQANARLRGEVAAHAAAGRPILAECGGLLFLCEHLDGHEMCGVVPMRAAMGRRLTLGYREATAATATPWLARGARLRGHEFHYTQVEPAGDTTSTAAAAGAPSAPGSPDAPAWTLAARGLERREGFVAGAVQASYLHVHWAAFPQVAHDFVAAARAGGPG